MNAEQIRARQLMNDLEEQAKELKEEVSMEMNIAITRALEQAYAIGHDDLKNKAIDKFRKNGILQGKKHLELAQVLKIFDIRVTKTGTETRLITDKKTEQ